MNAAVLSWSASRYLVSETASPGASDAVVMVAARAEQSRAEQSTARYGRRGERGICVGSAWAIRRAGPRRQGSTAELRYQRRELAGSALAQSLRLDGGGWTSQHGCCLRTLPAMGDGAMRRRTCVIASFAVRGGTGLGPVGPRACLGLSPAGAAAGHGSRQWQARLVMARGLHRRAAEEAWTWASCLVLLVLGRAYETELAGVLEARLACWGRRRRPLIT